MKKWHERPFEIKNLFNPAFCAVILLRAIKSYEAESGNSMPFSLVLLVLPLCLQKDSREIILANPRSYLLKSIGEHPQILIDFAERTKRLIPYTFEGLGFAMQLNSFEVRNEGALHIKDGGIRKKLYGTDETKECQKAAQIIGKKFAQIGDRITIYTTFGVRP